MNEVKLGWLALPKVLVILLSSCSITITSYSDKLVEFDGNGHAKTAAVYTDYSGSSLSTVS